MNDAKMFLNVNNSKKVGDDLIMSATRLHNLRQGIKTPEKTEIIDKLNKRLDEIVGKTEPCIFKNIIEKNNSRTPDDPNDFTKEIDAMLAGQNMNDKLSSLSEQALSKILRVMPRQIRQMIYVQRDTLTISQALLAMQHQIANRVVLFHVSERDIKDELRPGKNEDSIYFSTDIKRLFDLKNAKYIYAITVDKKTVEATKYEGAPDCFRKIKYQNSGDFEIEDKIKIFDEKDPSYRKRVLQDLDANFDSYSPADASGSNFLKAHQDDDSAFAIRA